jgi:hypothetical protein
MPSGEDITSPCGAVVCLGDYIKSLCRLECGQGIGSCGSESIPGCLCCSELGSGSADLGGELGLVLGLRVPCSAGFLVCDDCLLCSLECFDGNIDLPLCAGILGS